MREKNRLFAGAAGLSRPLFEASHPELGGAQDRVFALIHGLFWLCSNLAEQAPLLLAVDDAHWADRLSLCFLSLCERIVDLPVALIVACRPGQPDKSRDLLMQIQAHPATCALRLSALSAEATGMLV